MKLAIFFKNTGSKGKQLPWLWFVCYLSKTQNLFYKANQVNWFFCIAPDVIPKNLKGVGTWRNNMEISWEVTGTKLTYWKKFEHVPIYPDCWMLSIKLKSTYGGHCDRAVSLWPTESGMGPTWSIWCGGEGETPERSGKTPPPNGWDTISTIRIPSLLMRSKFKPSMILGWVQSLLLSSVTREKTVSIKTNCVLWWYTFGLKQLELSNESSTCFNDRELWLCFRAIAPLSTCFQFTHIRKNVCGNAEEKWKMLDKEQKAKQTWWRYSHQVGFGLNHILWGVLDPHEYWIILNE